MRRMRVARVIVMMMSMTTRATLVTRRTTAREVLTVTKVVAKTGRTWRLRQLKTTDTGLTTTQEGLKVAAAASTGTGIETGMAGPAPRSTRATSTAPLRRST